MKLSDWMPFVMSAFFCMGISPVLIPYLHRLKFDQTIREDGPTWHNAKGKTPTMGGIAFVASTTIGVLLGGFVALRRVPKGAVLVLLCALSFGFIGFIDDYIKVVKKRNLGLTARQKLLLQVLAAATFLWTMAMAGHGTTGLAIPFFNISLELGLLWYPVAIFILIGTVNAVNLTDGIDGLASCVTLPVALLFCLIGLRYRDFELFVGASALLGGVAGFLPSNLPKAKVFMGDTGAFFIGGAVAGLGFLAGMPVLLALCGVVYVLEALSDILQVSYFKATGGKRLFKMAPLHHHFEMCGYKEGQIDLLFTLVSIAGCLLAYLAYIRFYPIL
ncbi:MAG: phospho-N-acetylmuramoyl-pentapeptide-transferase [Clostridia bacterium]|nr:phospho-N-acetylmuramoyl-pentapeptide-transferase [Clostridia bacterium]